jgi:putative peptidoglycan lipid II flippase
VTLVIAILAALVLAGEGAIWIYYQIFARTDETRLVLSLTSVMLPYMLFVCLVAILAGLLNVHRHFAAPAAAPIVLNIFIIGTILLTGWGFKLAARQQLFCVAVAVLVAGLVQIALQLWPLHLRGVSLKPAWQVRSEYFRRIIVLMVPMILGLTATQINTLADDIIAWLFSGSEEKGRFFEFMGCQIEYPMWRGAVSHLYYAQRIYQLPLGVLGISLATAIFPVMSADAARGDLKALAKTVSNGLRGTVFVAVPATVGLMIVAEPLISAAFEHGRFTSGDTAMVVRTLFFYALGLCGYFAQQILARAFYSMQDSKAPTQSALIAVAANILLNLSLIWLLDRAGLACATALCSYLQVTILVVVLRKRLGHVVLDGLRTTAAKTLIATGVMSAAAAAVVVLTNGLPESRFFDVVRLAVIVPSASAAYLLTARMSRMEMLSLLAGRGRRTSSSRD